MLYDGKEILGIKKKNKQTNAQPTGTRYQRSQKYIYSQSFCQLSHFKRKLI